jgi:hypothetical protein
MLSEGGAASSSIFEAAAEVAVGCGSGREHAQSTTDKQQTKHEPNVRTEVRIPRFPSASPETWVDAS